jgi:hypothetical protein
MFCLRIAAGIITALVRIRSLPTRFQLIRSHRMLTGTVSATLVIRRFPFTTCPLGQRCIAP